MRRPHKLASILGAFVALTAASLSCSSTSSNSVVTDGDCPTGQVDCGQGCTILSLDASNCGACGTACSTDQVCSLGTCTGECAAGLQQCGQACVDTASSAENCGVCGNVCSAGQICASGSCACATTGQVYCASVGSCVDTSSDAANCGGCGMACVAGQACEKGVCGAGVGAVTSTTTGGMTSTGTTTGASTTTSGTGTSSTADGAGGTGSTTGGNSTTGGSGVGPTADGFYQMEDLNRGVVAVQVGGGVYVGWRMLGYEYEPGNPGSVSYNLYRDGMLVANVTDSTNYLDSGGNSNSSYTVSPVYPDGEGAQSEPVTPLAENYIRVPLESPSSNNHANDGSAADLDGDGDLELVLKWEANNSKDNSQAGVTDDVYLDGLELDGTLKWRINLGPNIRAGAHYTQFIVYDLDGDGKAELTVKTAPGTRDATGAYLSKGPAANDDDSAIYRNGDGYVLSGPEYLTVFSGETGEELATVNFDVARGSVSAWGDNYGNRVDRFLATAAHLDDTGMASVVMARGYYTRTTLTAWNFRNGELTQLWKFDSDESGSSWTGQGAHSLSVANVDSDKGQEIIYGAMTVDNDGKGLCNTQLNHGDALHVTDLIPSRPGLEVFMPHEYEARPTFSLRDARTCEVIQEGPLSDSDVGRGVAADVTAASPGAEMWASSGVPFMSAETGQTISGSPNSINFLIWWDADESRELEDGTAVQKFGGGNLQTCSSCSSNNGTKSTPVLVADLIGDWREEVIWRETNNSALRIYTTTDVTARRIYTLMHDPQYRVAISWQNVAYNQPPHPSFHIGSGMADPPKPDIHVK